MRVLGESGREGADLAEELNIDLVTQTQEGKPCANNVLGCTEVLHG